MWGTQYLCQKTESTCGSFVLSLKWYTHLRAFLRRALFQVTQIEAIKKKLQSADSVDLRRLLSTDDRPIDGTNVLASAGLWGYRRPLTLPALQNILSTSVKVHLSALYWIYLVTSLSIGYDVTLSHFVSTNEEGELFGSQFIGGRLASYNVLTAKFVLTVSEYVKLPWRGKALASCIWTGGWIILIRSN